MRNTNPLIILCLLTLVSCQDLGQLEDIQDVTYDATFAFPLLNSSLSLRDAVDELNNPEEIVVDPDGLLHFVYRGEVLSNQSSDVLEDISNTLPPVIPVLSNNFALPFAIPGQIDLEEIAFRSGGLRYTFQNNNPEPVAVTITSPQILVNGSPLLYEVNVPGYDGNGAPPSATNEDDPTPLSEVRVVPENDSVFIRYAAVTPGGQEVTLSNFFLALDQPEVSYAEGFLGQRTIPGGADEIEIDFFDFSYIDGTIEFSDPQITLFVENSYGIPTRAVINSFTVSTVGGETFPVTGELIEEGIDFPYPPLDQVGSARVGSFVFNKDNSNIDQLLSSNPRRVAYDIDIQTHPDGDTDIDGFLTDASYYNVSMEVDLPLRGQINGFTLRDTVDITIGDLSEVEEAEFKIVADNEIPIDADIQILFIDEQGQFIDSLLAADQQRLQGARMLPNGMGTEISTTEVFVPFSAERFEAVKSVASAVVRIRLSTESNPEGPVEILDEQEISVRVGAQARVQSN